MTVTIVRFVRVCRLAKTLLAIERIVHSIAAKLISIAAATAITVAIVLWVALVITAAAIVVPIVVAIAVAMGTGIVGVRAKVILL